MKASVGFLKSLPLVLVPALWIAAPQIPMFAQSTNCVPAPPGLVSWWAAEGNVLDRADGNSGALLNGATYGAGKVGLAYSVNGANQVAQFSDTASLDPTNAITLEGWVLMSGIPANTAPSIVEKGGGFDLDRQYKLGLTNVASQWFLMGQVFSSSGSVEVTGSSAVQTNTWYHVALTYDGSALKVYVNGNLDGSAAASGQITVSTHPMWIGGEPSGPWNFVGLIDEMSLYSRAVSAPELQAIYNADSGGKCTGPVAPFIFQQPANQTVYVGGTANFNVLAGGSEPLTYQWRFGVTNIPDATNSLLTLQNIQANQSGNYTVLVSNAVNTVASSNAVLTVNPLPPVPTISQISPSVAAAGSNVSIAGTNFSSIPTNNIVYFGATRATVTSADATNVVAAVPTGATFAPVTVTVGGLTAVSAQKFLPTFMGDGSPISTSSFATGQNLSTESGPYHTILADLDGDGKPDLIVANAYAHTVSIQRNVSTLGVLDANSFASRIDLPMSFISSGDNPVGIEIADIDGDGKLDVISAERIANQVLIFRNLSSPGTLTTNSFAVPVILTTGSDPRRVRVGDFDGDGKLDIVTANAAAGTISIIQNIGVPGSLTSGSFAAKVDLPAAAGVFDLTVADLDGDHRPDLAAVYSGGSSVSVFRNVSTVGTLGVSSFATGTNFPALTDGAWIVAVDVDGDGKLDLIDGAGQSDAVSVFRNLSAPGSVSFAPHVDFGTPGWVHNVTAGDFNGDGKPDIAVDGELGNYMGIYQNGSAAGSFTNTSLSNRVDFATGWNVWGISAGDVDGDSRPDVVFCNIYDQTITLYRNIAPFGGPPFIISQPTNQTVYAGNVASFSVLAGGSSMLSYQWSFNGTNIVGETNSTLMLLNVQTNQTGNYAVLVSNVLDSVLSSNAVLTVLRAPPCAAPPTNLVAWWQAEGSAADAVGGHNGTIHGGVTYAVGEVGQAFNLDGSSGYIEVPSTADLKFTGPFTAEAWVNYTDLSANSGDAIISKGIDSETPIDWSLTIHVNQKLCPHVFVNGGWYYFFCNTTLNSNTWYHVAMVYDGAHLQGYVNGVLDGSTDVSGAVQTSDYSVKIGAYAPINGGSATAYFAGQIDEVGLYNRALSPLEFQSIYAAGPGGKCSMPPTILVQPTNQTATVGNIASLSVVASGSSPLSYQWTFNGTNIVNATNSTLTLLNVQTSQSGNYAVLVTNAVDSILSSNALLSVTLPPACAIPPANLISLWRADGNPLDAVGGNNGTPVGNVTFTPGKIGESFTFDGNGDAVQVGNPATLQLQNFTIEGWIRRSNASLSSLGSHGNALFFGYGSGGYGFGISDDGRMFLTRVDIDNVTIAAGITDTNLHHVAVTKTNTTVVFYIDGIAYPAPPYNTSYGFSTIAAVGARGDTLADSFLGSIDELSIYGRALSAGEIQSIYSSTVGGKCAAPVAPFVLSQPPNRTVTVGGNTSFSVTVGGSVPFNYQWRFDGTNIVGETNSTLALSNIQGSQAGNYSVMITNAGGSTISSNGFLTVTFPPAVVRLIGTNAPPSSTVTVPIQLVANGNEYALSFSFTFDPSRIQLGGSGLLTYLGTVLGSGATNCTLLVNTNQLANGRLGLQIIKPWPSTFSSGIQEVVRVTLGVNNVTNPTSANMNFGDQPIVRQLLDNQGNSLAASFTGASISVAPASSLEGDVAPRPNGNRSLALNDWVLLGRYATHLDYPTNSGEFQRADCAPRSSSGDGRIAVTDWVQAGRYENGMDTIVVAGGPNSEIAAPGAGSSLSRRVTISGTTLIQGQIGSASVSLNAQGDENALGFGVVFDSAKLSFVGAAVGNDAGGATLLVNTAQAASGQLGFGLALPPGSTFAAGSNEIIQLNFMAISAVTGTSAVEFSDVPVLRETSDATAKALPTGYTSGAVMTQSLQPTLQITLSGTNVILSWPAWAANFNLQSAIGPGPANTWTNLVLTLGTNGENIGATQSISGTAQFFRLSRP